jgi:acetolactate synthase-1/3 small subunit
MLVKVRVDNSTRTQILEAATLFRARVVDVATDALVMEVTGDTAKVEALLRVLEPYGVKEIAQSGLLAMGRGSKSISERMFKNS